MQQWVQGQQGEKQLRHSGVGCSHLDCMLTSVRMKLMSATVEQFVRDKMGPFCVWAAAHAVVSAEFPCYQPVLGLVLNGRGMGLVLAFQLYQMWSVWHCLAPYLHRT